MPSHTVLQEIDRLDNSSHRFPERLTSILSGKWQAVRILGLEYEDAVWLIDYLDDVSVCVAPCPLPAQAAQALDTLDPTCSAYWTCLGELEELCNSWNLLPLSHIVNVSDLVPVDRPDVNELDVSVKEFNGLYNGSRVCVRKPSNRGSDKVSFHVLIIFYSHY